MRSEYIVTLPSGEKMKIYFYGKVLERILKAYNIPYKKIGKKK